MLRKEGKEARGGDRIHTRESEDADGKETLHAAANREGARIWRTEKECDARESVEEARARRAEEGRRRRQTDEEEQNGLTGRRIPL